LRQALVNLLFNLMHMPKRGIVYVATGAAYIKEAIFSASITRKHTSNPIYLITDNPDYPDLVESCFSKIIQHPSPKYSYRDKISALVSLEFDYTLFLDTDAFLVWDDKYLFTLLQTFDVAASHAPVRHPPGWSDSIPPITFPELNTGVLVLKNSDLQQNLVSSWLALYDRLFTEHSQSWDQASFRSTLWSYLQDSNLKFLVLPPEANLRTPKPWIIGRGMPALIVHGRVPTDELPAFLNYLNQDIDSFRTWSHWLASNPQTLIRPRFDNTFS